MAAVGIVIVLHRQCNLLKWNFFLFLWHWHLRSFLNAALSPCSVIIVFAHRDSARAMNQKIKKTQKLRFDNRTNQTVTTNNDVKLQYSACYSRCPGIRDVASQGI